VSYDAPAVGIYATNTLIQGNTCWSNVEVGIFGCMGTGSTVRWNEVWARWPRTAGQMCCGVTRTGCTCGATGWLSRATMSTACFGARIVHTITDTIRTLTGCRRGTTFAVDRGCQLDRAGNVFDLPDILGSGLMLQGCTNTYSITTSSATQAGHRHG